MSVDTYLQRKNTRNYRRLTHDDLEVLVAPMLTAQAAELTVDVNRFLFWRSLAVQALPRDDHFHGPT